MKEKGRGKRKKKKGKGEIERRKEIRGKLKKNWTGKKKEKMEKMKLREGRKSEER